MIGLTGGLMTLGFLIYSMYGQKQLYTLDRPASGEGSREESLQVEVEGKRFPVDITLQEIPYEEARRDQLLKEAALGLEKIFLKDNASLQKIVSDVSMPSEYPDSPVSIQWYLDSWEYVQPDGTVKNELLKEPSPVRVQAVLTLEDQSESWEKSFLICPPEAPDMEQKISILKYQVQSAQEKQKKQVDLPDSVLGERVSWYPAQDLRWLEIAVLTVLALCIAAAGRRSEEEKIEKQRERNMQLAYPDIVSRLSLYMGAGISTRKAWERIVESYEQKNGENESQAAYEEMRTALHEMQSGVPEALAYERFGTRCRLPSYLKLGALLSQNLRRGTRNLAGLLEEESREAFEDRKAFARKLGEECESKLLLPMILMLLTILIMIMYPAVASFQV